MVNGAAFHVFEQAHQRGLRDDSYPQHIILSQLLRASKRIPKHLRKQSDGTDFDSLPAQAPSTEMKEQLEEILEKAKKNMTNPKEIRALEMMVGHFQSTGEALSLTGLSEQLGGAKSNAHALIKKIRSKILDAARELGYKETEGFIDGLNRLNANQPTIRRL